MSEMPSNQQISYARMDHWRKYERFLPARLRAHAGEEPVEEWWQWCGAAIHLDRCAAPAAPLTVLLLHGAGGNGRLLLPYSLMFRRQGYEVVAPDLPGYGLSVVSSEMISYQRWVDCVVDLAAAEARRNGKRVVLFGMSIGGYLAYLAAAQGRKAAGVIATTMADPRLQIVRDQFARSPRLSRLLSKLLPPLIAVAGGMRLPVRWFANMQQVANDPELVHLLCQDPVGGGNNVPLRFLHSILAIRPAIEPENFNLCPVLLVHPAADRWTTIEVSQPFFDRIQGTKELVMLENCGHLPLEEPGVSRLEEAVLAFLQKLL
jgi:alpha-beta hydrolase superfamily lysophospholipase